MKLLELATLNESVLIQHAIPGFWIYPDGTIEGIPQMSYHETTVQAMTQQDAEEMGLDWEKIKDDPVEAAINAGFIRGTFYHGHLDIQGTVDAFKRHQRLLIQAINDPEVIYADIEKMDPNGPQDFWGEFKLPTQRQQAIDLIIGK